MIDYTKNKGQTPIPGQMQSQGKPIATTLDAGSTALSYDEGLRSYMLQIYNYMAVALLVTAAASYAVFSVPALYNAIFNSPLAYVVLFAPLAFVMVFSFRINKMSAQSAQYTFWAFSVVMGISLTPILAIYTGQSIAKSFLLTSSVFGAMSLYGYTTKRDLVGWGSFLFMGLIGVILASIVNFFLKSPAMSFALDVLTIIIFVGLTAYDTQRLKEIYSQVAGNAEQMKRVAIFGALSLYMNFINLFLTILRFVGDRR